MAIDSNIVVSLANCAIDHTLAIMSYTKTSAERTTANDRCRAIEKQCDGRPSAPQVLREQIMKACRG
jgi:hypothetical protein